MTVNSTTSNARARVQIRTSTADFCSGCCFVLALIAMLAWPVEGVRAEGSLEMLKSGLFHRKGWVDPDIYRKEPKSEVRVARRTTQPSQTQRDRGARIQTRANRRRARRKPPVRSPRRTPVTQYDVVEINEPVRRKRQTARRLPKAVVEEFETTTSGRKQPALKQRAQRKRVRVASLGTAFALPQQQRSKPKPSITGGGARVQWVASAGCLAGRLRSAIYHVVRTYGRVRVNSTCRSRRHNRRVGGTSRSLHLTGQAADIRIFGNVGGAARYLRSVAGGFKHYGGGLFHIDTGARRSW